MKAPQEAVASQGRHSKFCPLLRHPSFERTPYAGRPWRRQMIFLPRLKFEAFCELYLFQNERGLKMAIGGWASNPNPNIFIEFRD
jgi:hypothetical protein